MKDQTQEKAIAALLEAVTVMSERIKVLEKEVRSRPLRSEVLPADTDYLPLSAVHEFADRADLTRYATKHTLKDYAKREDLSRFITQEDLPNSVDLSGYATHDEITLANESMMQFVGGVLAETRTIASKGEVQLMDNEGSMVGGLVTDGGEMYIARDSGSNLRLGQNVVESNAPVVYGREVDMLALPGNALVTKNYVSRIVSSSTPDIDLSGYATEAWVQSQNYLTSIDLADYITVAQLNSELSAYMTEAEITAVLSGYVTDAELTTALASYVTDAELTTALVPYATEAWVTSGFETIDNSINTYETYQAISAPGVTTLELNSNDGNNTSINFSNSTMGLTARLRGISNGALSLEQHSNGLANYLLTMNGDTSTFRHAGTHANHVIRADDGDSRVRLQVGNSLHGQFRTIPTAATANGKLIRMEKTGGAHLDFYDDFIQTPSKIRYSTTVAYSDLSADDLLDRRHLDRRFARSGSTNMQIQFPSTMPVVNSVLRVGSVQTGAGVDGTDLVTLVWTAG